MYLTDEHIETAPQKLLSDEELLKAARTQPDVFGELLERYQEPFLRKAERVVRNREEAEEVVQDTFMKIYQYADRFAPQEGASFKSWGYRILMNTAITRYQKLKREKLGTAPIEEELYQMLPDRELRQFEKQEMRDLVVATLARIPERCSRILRMFYLDGKPQKEIARVERTTVGAIKTRMHRAKIEFRNAARSSLGI